MFGLTRHRLRVLEAAAWLLVYRVALKILPFKQLASAYERPRIGDGGHTRSQQDTQIAAAVKAAIQSAVNRLPKTCTCLCQALAAGRMLRRRDIASIVFIGAALDEAGEFESHAWIEAGAIIVAGATDVRRYKVMLTLNG